MRRDRSERLKELRRARIIKAAILFGMGVLFEWVGSFSFYRGERSIYSAVVAQTGVQLFFICLAVGLVIMWSERRRKKYLLNFMVGFTCASMVAGGYFIIGYHNF